VKRDQEGPEKKRGEPEREKRILRTSRCNECERTDAEDREKRGAMCPEVTEMQVKLRKKREVARRDEDEDETVVSSTVIKRRHRRAVCHIFSTRR